MDKFPMTMTLQTNGKLTASSKTNDGSLITVVQPSVSAPYDQASGMASGKRQHQPVTIRKEVDSASPQFFTALCNNEILKTVRISVSTGRGNHTVALIDMEIIEIKHLGAYEEVTFVFDDWQVNGVPGGILEPYLSYP